MMNQILKAIGSHWTSCSFVYLQSKSQTQTAACHCSVSPQACLGWPTPSLGRTGAMFDSNHMLSHCFIALRTIKKDKTNPKTTDLWVVQTNNFHIVTWLYYASQIPPPQKKALALVVDRVSVPSERVTTRGPVRHSPNVWEGAVTSQNLGFSSSSWGLAPNSWRVYLMENPIYKWMMSWRYPHDLGNLHICWCQKQTCQHLQQGRNKQEIAKTMSWPNNHE